MMASKLRCIGQLVALKTRKKPNDCGLFHEAVSLAFLHLSRLELLNVLSLFAAADNPRANQDSARFYHGPPCRFPRARTGHLAIFGAALNGLGPACNTCSPRSGPCGPPLARGWRVRCRAWPNRPAANRSLFRVFPSVPGTVDRFAPQVFPLFPPLRGNRNGNRTREQLDCVTARRSIQCRAPSLPL
jgi:hypothetical protein